MPYSFLDKLNNYNLFDCIIYTDVDSNDVSKYCIFNWVAPEYHGDDTEREMVHLVRRILEKWQINKIKSIALPPLGSGNLLFPVEKCVECIRNGIRDFYKLWCKQRNTKLKEQGDDSKRTFDISMS